MNIPGLQAAAARLISQNASTILTAGGVVGTCLTAALAAKAGGAAALKIDIEERERYIMASRDVDPSQEGDLERERLSEEAKLSKKEKLQIAAPLFIPPILLGAATIASIVWANQISAKRAAALAAAYGMSQERMQQYRAKLEEKLSGPKFEQSLDEIAQERVDKNPPTQVIVVEGGNVLCFDEYTGRYFRSSHEKIMRAQNLVNDHLFQVQYASLSKFYDEIGLPATSMSEEVGWNMATTGALEVRIGVIKSPENQEPCLSVELVVPPRADFRQNY